MISIDELRSNPRIRDLQVEGSSIIFSVQATTVVSGQSCVVPLKVECETVRGRPLWSDSKITAPEGTDCPSRWVPEKIEDTLRSILDTSNKLSSLAIATEEKQQKQKARSEGSQTLLNSITTSTVKWMIDTEQSSDQGLPEFLRICASAFLASKEQCQKPQTTPTALTPILASQ